MSFSENKFDLVNESFNFFEEFWIKLIYQNSDFFEWEKNYKFEKKENNPDTKEKYILHLKEWLSNIELTEILFSLQKELNLEKYDLLEDYIEKIKIKISLLISKNKDNKWIEEKFISEWLSKETIEEIKNYKIKNSLFKYRDNIKKIKSEKKENWKNQLTLEKDNFLENELFKTFYNSVTHNWFEYQRNFSKNYTREDFKNLVKKYNIKINDNIEYSKEKLLPTLIKEELFLEEESFLKDLLQLDKVKDKIKELIELKLITKEILLGFIKSVYLLVFQYPSIYEYANNSDILDSKESNFIDIVENKQIMCLTKNTLLYWLFSWLDWITLNSNLEPHHVSSNITFIDSDNVEHKYYLDSTLFLELNKAEKTKIWKDKKNKKIWGFEETLIINKNWKKIHKTITSEWKSKDILFSAYLANLMYDLSKNKNFWAKDFKILKNLLKYSTMADNKSYISYRTFWIWLAKMWKNKEALENFKKSLKIYPLDASSWKGIWKIIWWKNKIQYISFIVNAYNSYKLNKNSRKNLLKEETYESFWVTKKEFNKIMNILKTENFDELLEFLD